MIPDVSDLQSTGGHDRMRTIRRTSPLRPLPLLLLLLLAQPLLAQDLPRARPEDVGMSSERLERLTATFNRYVAEEQLAGAVVLVARRGKVAYLESFGMRDREAGAPMTTDAIFRIASQTKALVSVAVMMLQEEGKLALISPVGMYLPEF